MRSATRPTTDMGVPSVRSPGVAYDAARSSSGRSATDIVVTEAEARPAAGSASRGCDRDSVASANEPAGGM